MNGMTDYQRGYDDAMAQLRGNPEDWVPVKAKVGKAGAVFSMRFRPEELDALRLRAKKDGTTISGLIHAALEGEPLEAPKVLAVDDNAELRRGVDGWYRLRQGQSLFNLKQALPLEVPVTVTITERKP